MRIINTGSRNNLNNIKETNRLYKILQFLFEKIFFNSLYRNKIKEIFFILDNK